ncbi:hypothetical protein C8R44DRAFT_883374 [Mycena epipterygia]|nr:hypothetical protein C8R44DRAFT_883374 [Mycena epipterygia]
MAPRNVPPVNKYNNCCTICSNHLKPIQCKDGRWFLKCYSPSAHAAEGGRTYIYHFPPTDAPPNPAPSTDPKTGSSSSGTHGCPKRHCKSGRVNRECSNGLCMKHCVEKGDCTYTRHAPSDVPSPAISSTSRTSTAASTSQISTVSTASTSRTFNLAAAYEDIRQSVLAPLRALEVYQREQDLAAKKLDDLYGVKSPSPDTAIDVALRRVEEEELAEAIQRSTREAQRVERRRQFQVVTEAVSRSSPPPIPALAPLRPLSTTPDPPAAILSGPDYEFTSSLASTTPYSLRKTSQKRKRPSLSELAQQRFPLVFWPENGKPAVTRMVQDCPDWPIWIHGVEGESYECYSLQYQTWMTVPHSYKHCVATDVPIFIRQLGVIGSDEAEQVRRFVKGKGKAKVIEIDDDSDDEVVIVDYRPIDPPRAFKRARTSSSSSASPSLPTPSLPPTLAE